MAESRFAIIARRILKQAGKLALRFQQETQHEPIIQAAIEISTH